MWNRAPPPGSARERWSAVGMWGEVVRPGWDVAARRQRCSAKLPGGLRAAVLRQARRQCCDAPRTKFAATYRCYTPAPSSISPPTAPPARRDLLYVLGDEL
ncbi:hypothetical protein PVAP13_6KG406801 [Panicum virgatum]|uniref:Uncharacterized protein n=1 Tax=Panicum virgatum TaxID=38727 RepID=A0A8T0RLD7_PANVG|nr:hypothetical protein PVAP13_6KG406801 [Panicum virgatum]